MWLVERLTLDNIHLQHTLLPSPVQEAIDNFRIWHMAGETSLTEAYIV
jgi:hypothetical protein